MAVCSNCNNELPEGAKFCGGCGSKVAEAAPATVEEAVDEAPVVAEESAPEVEAATEEAMIEEAPVEEETTAEEIVEEAPVIEEAKEESATPVITEEAPAEEAPAEAVPAENAEAPKSSKAKVGLIIGGLALLGIIIIALGIWVVSGIGGGKNQVLYIKDKEVYFSDLTNREPLQVTSKLVNASGVTNSDLAEDAYFLRRNIRISPDGKMIFYPDKVGNSDSFTLYCRRLDKPKAESVKIDSGIDMYDVNEKFDCVTYIKSGKLYQHNLTDKEKIASDVSYFYTSDDGKKILYVNDEDDAYIKEVKKDKEKIDSEIEYIVSANGDLSEIYYLKEDVLYKKAAGKDKEKIASDVYSVAAIFDSGEMYYSKKDSDGEGLMAYVDDDMKSDDARMKEPVAPEYPSYWDYDTFDEYYDAVDLYEIEYDIYWDSYEKYREKLNRDEMRKELSENELSFLGETLYYYDGKEEHAVAENFSMTVSNTIFDKDALVIFESYEADSLKKIKLSEVKYAYMVEEMLREEFEESVVTSVAIAGEVTPIDIENPDLFEISEDGKSIYVLEDYTYDKDCFDLYKISISGKEVGSPELYDNDVYSWYIVTSNGNVIYLKDVDETDFTGDLYLNKELVDSDVQGGLMGYNPTSGKLAYITDYNTKKEEGMLKVYKNGKITEISDDVHDYGFTDGGDVLYLYDYSTKSCKGELYQFKNNKPKKIDEDVVAIIYY